MQPSITSALVSGTGPAFYYGRILRYLQPSGLSYTSDFIFWGNYKVPMALYFSACLQYATDLMFLVDYKMLCLELDSSN